MARAGGRRRDGGRHGSVHQGAAGEDEEHVLEARPAGQRGGGGGQGALVDEALQLADRIVVLGRTGPTAPASISTILAVPGERPRARASEVLAELRVQLLGHLGVDTHHPATR